MTDLAPLDAASLHALFEHALDAIDAPDDEDDEDARGRDTSRTEPRHLECCDASTFSQGLRALRLAAALAATAGEVDSLPTLVRGLRTLRQFDDRPPSDAATAAMALARAAWRRPPPPEVAARIVAHRSAAVRRALAHGLDARDPRARELLGRLVVDLDPCVRAAARASLPDGDRPGWWVGLFDAEPADAPPVLREVLDDVDGDVDAAHAARFVEAWRTLPPELRRPAAARLYATLGAGDKLLPLVLEELLAPGSEAALVALLQRLRDGDPPPHGLGQALVAALAARPPETYPALVAALADFAVTSAGEPAPYGLRSALAALFAAAHTPPDPTFLVDLALRVGSRPEHASPIDAYDLVRLLPRAPWPEPLVARIIAAWEAGFPPPWRPLAWTLQAGVRASLPPGTPLPPPPGPTRAAPAEAGAELARQRAALRAGELAPEAVRAVCDAIDRAWAALLRTFGDDPDAVWVPETDAAFEAPIPPELRGPRRADEDEALRRAVASERARLEAIGDHAELAELLTSEALRVGPGPWRPGEREAALAALEALEALAPLDSVDAWCLQGKLAALVAKKGTSADLVLVRRIADEVPDVDLEIASALEVGQRRHGAAAMPPRRRHVRPGLPAGRAADADDPTSRWGLPLATARALFLELAPAWIADELLELEPDAYLADPTGRRHVDALRERFADLALGLGWALADDADEAVWEALVAIVANCRDGRPRGAADALDDAIATVLDGASADALAGLVRHRSASIRRALVWTLDPADPEQRAHLFALAEDAHPRVRGRALRQLEGHDRPWWLGHFRGDPFARLASAEAAEHAPSVARVVELLAAGPHRAVERDSAELARAIDPLPDALVVELVQRLLPDLHELTRDHAPLLRVLLARDAGLDAWLRVLARLDDVEPEFRLEKIHAAAVADDPERALPPLTPDARRRIAERALAEARRADVTALATLELALAAWPPDTDVDPVLAWWIDLGIDLADDAEDDDRLLTRLELDRFLRGRAAWAPGPALAARIEAAAEAGLAEPWLGPLDTWLLDRLPAATRRHLARSLRRAPRAEVRAWALARLVGDARAPDDGPPEGLLADASADPDDRAALLVRPSLTRAALPWLYPRLLAGVATAAEAVTILRALPDRPPEAVAAWRRAWRAEVAALAPGPSPARQALIYTRLVGDFEPEDLAFFARVADDADAREALLLVAQLALYGVGDEARALIARVVARYPDHAEIRDAARHFESR